MSTINATKTYLPNKEVYTDYVNRIFENGWLTNNGHFLQELEKKLQEYLSVSNILLVSNGTLALQIMYKTLGLTGNVITTPFSFVASTSSLVWQGLEPRFVDISPDFLTIDEEKIQNALDEKTSAILGVHVYGNPCNIEKLIEISKKNNIKLIFDAAHCFGVKYRGESILNYGDASILSFHSTKLFHTIEGGAIIFKKKTDLEKAKRLRNFGITGPETVEDLGINAKMNEFAAAMGLSILGDIHDNIEARRKIAEYYSERINPKYLQLQWRENTERNFAYYPILCDHEARLIKMVQNLNEKNIFPRRYFVPSLNKLPYLNQYIPMPISEDVSRRILCLPLYETLTPENLDLIIKEVNNV